jgi:tetratricopeptide (TPR) repeat protein
VHADLQDEWSIPPGVRDLLQARLGQVGEAGRQLLQTAAAIGRSFDVDILRVASGRSDEETVETLEVLIAHYLIREAQLAASGSSGDPLRGLVYDFTHNKVRSLIYTETSLARRRLLHQRVADALAARARGRPQGRSLAGQIATHYRQAGNSGEAASYFYQAGEHDRSLYANAEALAHYQAALALGSPDTGALDEAIGDLYTLLGNYSAALNSYAGALAHLGSNASHNARLEHKLGSIYHRLGEWGVAESHYQAASQALGESGEVTRQARLLADWSHTAQRRGHPDQALEMANQALHLAEKSGNSLAQAQAHNTLGILARSRDNLQEAVHHLERSLVLAENSQEASARVAALNNLSLATADGGDLERALQYAHQALEVCRQQGDRHREAALHNNLADLYHAAGQEERSMQHLKQAVVIFAEIGVPEGERSQAEIWKLSEW